MTPRPGARPVFLLTAILLASAASEARAYVDPNAGSVLLQMILAGVAGVAVVVRIFWKKIVDRIRRR